jgi:hypothetical protein
MGDWFVVFENEGAKVRKMREFIGRKIIGYT